jgi:HPt (histidine-containing phosphotransfer) domain-containing protein
MLAEAQMRIETHAAHLPIDLAFLSNQTLGDDNLAVEVLRLFDEMGRTYFRRLENSTTMGDLLRNLHTLKGAAAGVGAFALAQRAREMEAALNADMPVDPRAIDGIGAAMAEVSAYIGTRVADAA